ncbi:MAG: hypothetical protein K8H75_08805 [Sulfuricella sp.]|nr:hypothetical protein [Sulfuricella sp.]
MKVPFSSDVEFFPNEPGIPFGDNLAHQVSCICRQFGDNKIPALPRIRLLPVTNSEFFEVMEKGGDLIHVEVSHGH